MMTQFLIGLRVSRDSGSAFFIRFSGPFNIVIITVIVCCETWTALYPALSIF